MKNSNKISLKNIRKRNMKKILRNFISYIKKHCKNIKIISLRSLRKQNTNKTKEFSSYERLFNQIQKLTLLYKKYNKQINNMEEKIEFDNNYKIDFSEVKGQKNIKRAIEDSLIERNSVPVIALPSTNMPAVVSRTV